MHNHASLYLWADVVVLLLDLSISYFPQSQSLIRTQLIIAVLFSAK